VARGEVRYRFIIDAGDAANALKVLQGQVKSLGGSFASELGGAGKIIEALGPAGIAAAAGVGALVAGVYEVASTVNEAVSHLTEFAKHLEELSLRTGASVETLQEWNFAAKVTGVSVDQIANAANKMQKALYTSDEAFTRIGLSAAQLRQMAPEEAFAKVADAIRALPTAAEQAKAAILLFGKAGAEMLPLIKEGLGDLSARARELGIVMSGDDVAAAAAFKRQTDELGAAWEGFKNQLAATLVKSGAMQAGVKVLIDAMKDLNHWVIENKDALGLFASAATSGVESLAKLQVEATKSVGSTLLSAAKSLFSLGFGTDVDLVYKRVKEAQDQLANHPAEPPKPPPPPPNMLTDAQQKLLEGLTGGDAMGRMKDLNVLWAQHAEEIGSTTEGYTKFISDV